MAQHLPSTTCTGTQIQSPLPKGGQIGIQVILLKCKFRENPTSKIGIVVHNCNPSNGKGQGWRWVDLEFTASREEGVRMNESVCLDWLNPQCPFPVTCNQTITMNPLCIKCWNCPQYHHHSWQNLNLLDTRDISAPRVIAQKVIC